ncbi:MAG: sugar phosphate isomerase/epimerase [Candidatus Hydrogenedentes bacterium]|nr:sugar phosphate isomerase/epimerase [Candidatus Hydrogenedentota bacterium]
MGAQSYSFRNFDLDGAIQCLKDLGLAEMEFCRVHFPPDAADENFPKVQAAIEAAGITVPCFGVEGFGDDARANRAKFEFAAALGVHVLSADPAPESFDNLDALCDEFGIQIAIHNHGPGARYDKVADTLNAVNGHSPLIGACLDTGHCIRSSERPEDVIAQLGDRLISLHLKDWSLGGAEQIIGQGDLNLPAVAAALRAVGFNGPVVMEYEESPDNPVPDMKIGWANWQAALAGA